MSSNSANNDQMADSSSEYLTFSLGDDQYGIDILKVKEIRGWETLRELHGAPDYVKGVLDFRGRIVPIIDLRIRFGIAHYEYSPTTVIIILATEDDSDMMGVVVDAVSDVLSIKLREIKPAPDLGSKINIDYIRGMVSNSDKMIMLVDSEKLVDKEELEASGSAAVE